MYNWPKQLPKTTQKSSQQGSVFFESGTLKELCKLKLYQQELNSSLNCLNGCPISGGGGGRSKLHPSYRGMFSTKRAWSLSYLI